MSSGQKEALENVNEITEGQMPQYLHDVLEVNLPKTSGKKASIILGVSEKNLAGAIKASFPGISCETADTSDVCAEILRGIRVHANKLIDGLNDGDLDQAGRGLGHAYSRGKIMFDPKRNDQSIIQALATVEANDKVINSHYMRLREAYGWHFPELSRIESDNHTYAKLVQFIGRKEDLSEDKLHDLAAVISEDGEKAQAILDASKMSMGRDLGEEDHQLIRNIIEPLVFSAEARKKVARDLEITLGTVAPNLQALIGTMVTARLIQASGGLATLCKYPASTLQILGAEKALFRALKAKSNTPKYGIIYHSSFIGRASQRDKGRISRFLANKCSIAARIDYFSTTRSTKYGDALKQQVEDRLEFFATGKRPAKNSEVMVSHSCAYLLLFITNCSRLP
jgi:nucleolar protein 56